ncbi:alpha/beta hydrolase [Aggregicoccus sp. 17bor-14]|uniref:alpha/beta hydrolase n=1 Tax=Myxococcaceae TaxID=31 RepID=UPI00129C9E6A|nr:MULTISPECIES: alpha/beta hydrolase [Myxococcaceae]MBF5041820.1 alpha/beta hydrolase [Simulacricoccus sp. 17bor-14]MRI87601.1 alpha/beta hydrolase [Aggregicoccus sp. 17bor-14]
MSSGTRLLVIALSTLALGYLLLCVLVWAGQRALMFPAPRAAVPLPGGRGYARVEAGVLLVRAPPQEPAPWVVYFHGNGEQLSDLEGTAEALQARGLGFLGVEYPGYGWAGGAPTEAGLYAAGRSALAWLQRERGVGPERVVLLGRSLGSGVAVQLAQEGRCARLVLVSPYTSMGDMAAAVFPWLPGRLLVRDRFDSLSKAAGLHVPTLVVHGTRDEVVPVAQGRRLAAAIPGASALWVEGAGHNDVLERGWGGAQPFERVVQFARGD